MRLLHDLAKIHATFDDPNLVSRAGLVPVMALAQRAGLGGLVEEHVRVRRRCGVNAQLKVPCVVAGMIGGADSIDDLGLLRHGAMPALFGGVRAPSTLGSFLRSFTWGNVLQVEKVSRLLLAELGRRAPLLPGKNVVAFVDIDSMQRRVYGRQKQGAAFGHTKIQGKSLLVRGLNALAATIGTPLGAPVIAATRLRGGNAASCRGAASFATEAVHAARATGCSGTLVARAGSAFYSAAFTGAVRAAGAFFSVTVQMNPHARAAIAAIGEDAWTPINYPRAIWDDQLACWVSDAEVAEVKYTAFTSTDQPITARLIVRRVKDLNRQAAAGQDELFPVWRYHAIFTDSRSSCWRPRPSTVTTPRSSRYSPTWPAGRWLTCRRGRFPPTRPGLPWPRSATTCCAPPGPWPASPAPRPAAPRCAATSSTSPAAPPATAAARSPCTCPKAGTARPNG